MTPYHLSTSGRLHIRVKYIKHILSNAELSEEHDGESFMSLC